MRLEEINGPVDQSGRSLPWHGRGRGFETKVDALTFGNIPPGPPISYMRFFIKLEFPY